MIREAFDCKVATKLKVEELCSKHGIAVPRVTFNVKGTDAGRAYVERNWIDLNMVLFRENFEDMVANTIPHEIVHCWHYALKLGGKAHGREWQGLMKRIGVRPIPCHNLNTDAAESPTGFFSYRCLCNVGNMVSLETHRRIQENPEWYRCGKCRELFVFVS